MASQSGISSIQKDNGMGGWNDGDRTNFKSSFTIITADGNTFNPTEQSPMPFWESIPEGSKLKWEIETISDGKGKSDKAQIDISYMNYPMILRELDLVLNSLTQDQRDAYQGGDKVMDDTVNKLVAQRIADSGKQMDVNIFSKQIITGDDGKAEGEIPMDSWPQSEYNIMIHYGYMGDMEASGSERMWDNIGNTAMVVGFLALSFIPGIGWAAQAALIGAEIAVAVAIEMMKPYGEATINKYDDAFPNYGFNHPYAFGYYGEDMSDLMGNISTENQSLLEQATRAFQINNTFKIGIGLMVAILIMNKIRA
jgi:hypothetical protein